MKKNMSEEELKSCKKKTSIGGQALMEGLMMIGPEKIAMAVRKGDGEIHVETSPIGKSSKAAKIPFVRGSVKIFRQMVTGTSYLMKSAEFAEEAISAEAEDSGKAKKVSRLDKFFEKHTSAMLYGSVVFGILLSVGLFILLPNLISNLALGSWLDRNASAGNRIIHSLAEGVMRFSIFIGYLALASRLKDIKRVWMYHGAEHKTIACYESRLPLTVDNVRGFSKHHPRCGTAFMFIVLLLSIILFSFVPRIHILVDMLIRLALVPVLASLSYELIHFTAKHDNTFTAIMAWPGLMLQRLTTSEPDDRMMEVAIAAMVPVIPAGERGDEW